MPKRRLTGSGGRGGAGRRVAWACAAMALTGGSASSLAQSDREALAARYPELHAAIYDVTVCEYCGLISPEVATGFRRRAGELITRDGLDERTVRDIRIAAWTAADLEWANRGVGGFRNWCRTEGTAAARRFVAYETDGAAAPRAAE